MRVGFVWSKSADDILATVSRFCEHTTAEAVVNTIPDSGQ
jgi:hypothetical protein